VSTRTDDLLARIEHLEENRRFVQNALEMALSLCDFQKNINRSHNPVGILEEAHKRTGYLIPFEASAWYLTDEASSDFVLSLSDGGASGRFLQDEVEFMIDRGMFGWALREKRGVAIPSGDHSRQFLLHVIATYSRIRGMFVGLLPAKSRKIPDASLTLLSILLRNAANALESHELYRLMHEQHLVLEEQVQERAGKLLQYERKIQHIEKMEAMGTLAGGVAHDLNNILSGLVSYPELLLMDLEPGHPLRGPILSIKRSGEKAAAIVQDLLTLARRGVALLQVVNLNHIVQEHLNSPEHERLRYHHPEVEVRTDLAPDLLNVNSSPVHLSKTVMNLLSNAAEAMPDGGTVLIRTQNRYVDRPLKGYEEVQEGEYVCLMVSDTGTGMAAEEMQRIFEPFYTKKVMGRSGTGLGMAIVWGTVKDHKGYIELESAPDKGSTFTLFFPGTREGLSSQEAVPIEHYMGNGERVLVVDDVKEQREIASAMLRRLRYSVDAVASGEEAVAYLKSTEVDLVVLDMIMDPGIDGLETYKRILALRPGQRAVITSGFSQTSKVKEAQELGAGDYVRKPYLLEQIGRAVWTELAR